MSAPPPIPANIYRRLQDFLAAGGYGRFVLIVEHGRVTRGEVLESIAAESDDAVLSLREPAAPCHNPNPDARMRISR